MLKTCQKNGLKIAKLKTHQLSSGNSPSLSLSPIKNARESTKVKSRKRPSHHPAFSDVVSGASRRARRETSRRLNQPIQAPGNASVLPEGALPLVLPIGTMPPMSLVHPSFGTGPTFYMPLTALICRPDDMLSSVIGQHVTPRPKKVHSTCNCRGTKCHCNIFGSCY